MYAKAGLPLTVPAYHGSRMISSQLSGGKDWESAVRAKVKKAKRLMDVVIREAKVEIVKLLIGYPVIYLGSNVLLF